jgi:predicted dehydrogenase
MAERRVGWGILGAAKIAWEWLAPAIQASDRGAVVAVASRDPARGGALAASCDARLHTDYDALLADPAVDAVYVPLPNADHVAWTLRALDAGKHVLCEKPIALAADEIDALIARRDATGLVAAEAFMVVHHPQWRRLRALLGEGAIGRLRAVQGAFAFFNDDPANIRNQAALGGGALRDIGVYPCVTTRFATGAEPVAVTAEIDWEGGIDATARVMARFPGFTLDFLVSMRMAPVQRMTFFGESGWIAVEAPFNAGAYGDEVLEWRRADGLVTRERFPRADQYRAQIDAFNAAVLDGAAFACPLEFSRGNQAMIDRIYAAAEAA